MDKDLEKPLISVIVPLYNREKTIINCLNSIKDQTFKNFEVLVVDGQSTDNSRKLISDFAKEDSRFKLIENNESHVTPDNVCLGLKNVNGEYVTFVDSDDTVLPEFLETLYGIIQKYNVDISQINFTGKDSKSSLDKLYIGKEYKKLQNNIFGTTKYHSRCNRMFKTSLINDVVKYYSQYHDIIWEDTLFTYALFLAGNSFYMSSKQLYNYDFKRNNDCPKRIYNDEYFERLAKLHTLNVKLFEDYKMSVWQAYNIPIIPIYEMFIESQDKIGFIKSLKQNKFMFECVKKYHWKKGSSQRLLILFRKASITKLCFVRKILVKFLSAH